METAVVCSGLLGLLIFGLGFMVSITRGQTGTNAGTDADPADRLHKMVRAHGNAAEYAPMLALLMLIVARGDELAGWVMWTMILVTACRYLHALGMVMSASLDKAHPLRAVGALGTYLGGVIPCIAAFMAG